MSRCFKVEAVIGPMSKIGPMPGLMSRCTHGPMSRWSNVEAVICQMSRPSNVDGLMSRYTHGPMSRWSNVEAVIGPMSRPSNVENGSNVEILLWSNVEMVQCRGFNGPMSRQ